MRFRRLVPLLGIVLAVGAVTGATLATSNVARLAVYQTSLQAFDSLRGYQVGGYSHTWLAQDSLKVGDIVYDTLGNVVRKSATLKSYDKFVGVVIGGARTTNRAAMDSTDVGTLAATANQRVIIAQYGRVWVKLADSAYAGDQMIPSTAVAGTVKRRTTAIDTFNRVFGRAIYTRDSGKAMLVELKP